MPRLLYTVLLSIFIPLYFLRLVYKGIGNKDYLFRWKERLGLYNSSPDKSKKLVWIHSVSVGEVNASIPLIRNLLNTYPDFEILVTTTTPTGSDILLNQLGSRVKHQYIPIDLPLFIKVFLNHWRPEIFLILETEIWPNFINECNKRLIPSVLLNARLSDESKDSYLKIKSLIEPTLRQLDKILVQFESDKVNFNLLDPSLKIQTCGNLKFDQEISSELSKITNSIRASWSIEGKNRPTLIAASTHELEEEILLDSFKTIRDTLPNSLLILVPRHLERSNKVKKLISRKGFNFSLRSQKENVTEDTEVLLGDTMGELSFLYALSDLAFVGGSLIDHGGQNLLEPASLGLPICSGPHLRNFLEISRHLKKEQGLKIINNSEDITKLFLDINSDKQLAESMGQAAQKVYLSNRGALDNILNHLHSYFK